MHTCGFSVGGVELPGVSKVMLILVNKIDDHTEGNIMKNNSIHNQKYR